MFEWYFKKKKTRTPPKTNPCPVLWRSLEILEPSTDIFTATTERRC